MLSNEILFDPDLLFVILPAPSAAEFGVSSSAALSETLKIVVSHPAQKSSSEGKRNLKLEKTAWFLDVSRHLACSSDSPAVVSIACWNEGRELGQQGCHGIVAWQSCWNLKG